MKTDTLQSVPFSTPADSIALPDPVDYLPDDVAARDWSLVRAVNDPDGGFIDGNGVLRYFGQFGHRDHAYAEEALKAVLAGPEVEVKTTMPDG